MNALVLLTALLGLSYFAGLVGSGRDVRGLGLPSGVEWVTLGVVLGPLLGVVGPLLALDVTPVALAATGWYALVLGLDFGVVRRRRVAPLRMLGGIALALALAAPVVAVAWFVAPRFLELSDADRWTLALGLGAVWSSTTPHAVRWGRERLNASGPVSDLLADLADVRDLVPIVLAGTAFAWRAEPASGEGWIVATGAWVTVVALLAGLVLGVLAALLLRGEFERRDAWGVLVGASALATGAALRLGESALFVPFLMGLGLAMTSRHRAALSAMVDPTERPALLPALILAGVQLDPSALLAGWGVVLLTGTVRFAAGFLSAHVVLPKAPGAAALAMGASGGVGLCTGLLFSVRFPGAVGGLVLGCAVVAALLGEVVGAIGLRRALAATGEVVGVGGREAPPDGVGST